MLIVVHCDQEGHSVSTPWQRTDKEISFSELAITCGRDRPIGLRSPAKGIKFACSNFCSFIFAYGMEYMKYTKISTIQKFLAIR